MIIQPPAKGLGVVPLFWALGAGVFAAGAATQKWGTCNSWYCLPNIKRSLFYSPETPPPTGPQSVPPSAPQSTQAMTIPDAWNVDEMLRQTAEAQKAFRAGAKYSGDTQKQAAPGGTPLDMYALFGGGAPETTDEEKTLMLVLAAVAGFVVLAYVVK